MLSFTLFAESEPIIRYSPEKTEWFAFALGGSTYGVTANFAFATVRWKYFFWEMISVQGGCNFYDALSIKGKSVVGVPIFLNWYKKDEIRIGAGFGTGINIFNTTISFYEAVAEISFINHLSYDRAFQLRIGAGLPISYKAFIESDCAKPDGTYCGDTSRYIPDIYILLGLRF